MALYDLAQISRRARRRRFVAGTMIEAAHAGAQGGSPYPLQGDLDRVLQRPLNPTGIVGVPVAVQQNVAIPWTTQLFQGGANNVLPARPDRVILIVQNLSSTVSAAVNYDQAASISGALPNQLSQGTLLLPGASIYVDRWTPTGAIYIYCVGGAVTVTQGFSAGGNTPNPNIV